MAYADLIESKMLIICDSNLDVASVNSTYVEWVERDMEGVLGHCIGEWLTKETWELGKSMAAEAIKNNTIVSWKRDIITASGMVKAGVVTARPIMSTSRRQLVVCACQISNEGQTSNVRATFRAADLASYIEDLASSLAKMTENHGLLRLTESLENVAGEAAEAAVRLLHDV